jgi:hypothetical protein
VLWSGGEAWLAAYSARQCDIVRSAYHLPTARFLLSLLLLLKTATVSQNHATRPDDLPAGGRLRRKY